MKNRDFLRNVMTAAVENGLGWATIDHLCRVSKLVAAFGVTDAKGTWDGSEPWKEINADSVCLAIEKIIGKGTSVADWQRRDIASAYFKADFSLIDARLADIIIQVAATGNVITERSH